MPRKKADPPTVPHVTVAELLLALASFPQDASLTTYENGGGGGSLAVLVGDEFVELWDGHYLDRPHHYVAPAAVVVERGHPGDDFEVAQEFIAWAKRSDLALVHPGRGHGELDSPVRESAVEIAQRFASRRLDDA